MKLKLPAANAVLTADITLDSNSTVWTPIGKDNSYMYTGTFDGDGHTISGLKFAISSNSDAYVGLFGCIGSGGTVKNVSVEASSLSASAAGDNNAYAYAGSVCGRNYGTITNCTSTGTVTAEGDAAAAGGVCGENYAEGGTATITNCASTGAVIAEGQYSYAGGVCGWNEGTITNCYWLTDSPQGGIGGGSGTVGNVESKTSEQFASGEVAWLLNNKEQGTTHQWAQELGTEQFPRLMMEEADGQYDVVKVTVNFPESSSPTPKEYYININQGLKEYPVKDGETVYEFYESYDSGTYNNRIDNRTKTYGSDTDIYAKAGTAVTGITLEDEILAVNSSVKLTADVYPENASYKDYLTWESNDPGVATVNQTGTVTAMGAGDATITVTADGGKTASCEVKVREPATVEPSGSTNISLTTDQDEFTLTATVQVNGDFLNPTDGSWKWSVANEDIVALGGSPTLRSVSVSSCIQAFEIKSLGTTTITTTYDDGKYRGSVDFTITVEIPPVVITYHDLHITESTGAKLVSRYGKTRTPDGGSFTLSLEKEEGYEDCEPTVYYKRGRFGDWKELKLDEVSGYYQIRSVYTDIYVKVSGDGIWPVSNETVEAQEVEVYTRDGAIVVSTPSLTEVQIVSMTGSVVAADKVAGKREFRNLAEGIYVVRAGDCLVKVRL